jgi:amidohydrolase
MDCVNLRHKLHQHPELSNVENGTAARLVEFMMPLAPDKIITGIGGTGVAVCFGDASTGKVVMLRCELDALPINETNSFVYRSVTPGVSHKCGHDGHMAILAAVAKHYGVNKPKFGQVILMFQPAEETGEGAKNVLSDELSQQLKPDYVFALHNAPKHPLGDVIIKSGTMCCASRGLIIRFTGKTAHAAQPETGVSPVTAIYQLLPLFEQLPTLINSKSDFTFATVVGINVGEKAFGTAPADGEVYVTLRSQSNVDMQALIEHTKGAVLALANEHGLTYDIQSEDVFDATVNNVDAVSIIHRSLHDEPVITTQEPFRWSEDFGQFTAKYCGALFGLGAGEKTPALHNPDYDFPDALIETGCRYFIKITEHCFSLK